MSPEMAKGTSAGVLVSRTPRWGDGPGASIPRVLVRGMQESQVVRDVMRVTGGEGATGKGMQAASRN